MRTAKITILVTEETKEEYFKAVDEDGSTASKMGAKLIKDYLKTKQNKEIRTNAK